MTNVRTICEIILETSVGTEMLSEVIKLLFCKDTNSTAERSFSALRRLKTFLRSTMTQPRLNHTWLAYIHTERTDEIKDENIVEDFVCAFLCLLAYSQS